LNFEAAPMVKANLRCAGASDPGRIRRNNEDAFHMDADRGIFVVVDGMGGQAAGEKAAAIAIERVKARLERRTGSVEQRVREAIAVANNEILAASRTNPAWQGMACVLTLAVIEDGSAVVGHVGDSRLYQVRGGAIRKVTHDHSPVGEREDSGEISEADAMRHPRRNEVFRDVGSEEHSPEDPDFIEVQRIPFQPDSALILCSDGLSDLVPSSEIRRAVEQNAGDPDAAVRKLIELANNAGGKDNVTVLVVEGEAFKAPGAAPVPVGGSRMPVLLAAVLFMGGLVAGGVAGYLLKPKPVPPPLPALLSVGPGQQYTTISEAIAAAREGDTVEVATGEYTEQLTLKTGVDVRASSLGGAILRAPAADVPVIQAQNVHDIRLAGFRVLAAPQAAVNTGVLLADSAVEIADFEIAGAATGIEIRGSVNPTVRATSIIDCTGPGILVSGTAQPWISHNWLRRNRGGGVVARESARPALIGNYFDGNGVELPAGAPVEGLRERNIFTGRQPGPARQPVRQSSGAEPGRAAAAAAGEGKK
jgi:serine/threonine protein phosphatase PrpC